ncbi:MAG TPA: MarR family transcriptional regulator [Rhodospirillales bacterium]|nr:MarR family transcriptional regulator [Rhodospirillales bacterium]
MTDLTGRSGSPLEKRRLRMWIRMLRTTRAVENRLRVYLREKFDTTLPRFDVLAALYRAEYGLKMSALSKQLLVSNGNVTGIIDRLVADGQVERVSVKNDRRAVLVCLTPQGRTLFSRMAAAHEDLINDLFGHMVDDDLNVLVGIFRRLK